MKTSPRLDLLSKKVIFGETPFVNQVESVEKEQGVL